eukprot:TRINITY_DN731_c0_g2_i1.p1 TRINITY_DN731_c0_g2~~TRINITY_DN731_c0_g2_i1.p1  ORF type:complete len:1613 (+),score=168.32 TRINITY_DN731_c0_g2_i1:725-4840(+)
MQRVLFAIVATVGVTQAQSPLMMGSGSSLLAPLFRNWHESYNNLPGKRAFRYDSTGSGTGVKRVLRNESHWIGSEATLTDADYAMYPGIQMLPIAISPIAIMFNVVGTDGSPILGLRLDRGTLARIYSFDVTYWDDARIQALNPAVLLPHNVIRPVVRADSSGTSVIMSSSLVSFGWADTAGCGVEGAGCEVTKKLHQVSPGPRNASGHPLHAYESASGSSGVTDFVKHNANTIGYVGVATAIDNRVSFAVVVNKLGAPRLANRDAAELSAASAVYDPVRLTTAVHDQEGYPVLGMAYLAYWRQFNPAQQFVGIEPEWKGFTKDYKEEVDLGASGSPRGENWGYPANEKLHDPGKTCEEHSLTLDYLYWLYTSPHATSVVVTEGLVPVPQGTRNRVLGQLWESRCEGGATWATGHLVDIHASDTSANTLNELAYRYHQKSVELGHTAVVRPLMDSAAPIIAKTQGDETVVPPDYLAIPVYADGVVLVYNPGIDGLQVPLEMTVDTIRSILSGTITRWSDPAIAERNTFAPLPADVIEVAATPSLFRALLQLTGTASPYVRRTRADGSSSGSFTSEAEVAAHVYSRTGVFGVLTLATARKWPLSQVYIVTSAGEGGTVVTPSVESVSRAITEATWSNDLTTLNFTGKMALYPFVSVTWLYIPRHFSGSETHGQAVYDAVQWLSGAHPYRVATTLNEAADALGDLGYAAAALVPAVQSRVDLVFRSLTVNGRAAYPGPSSSTSLTWLWFLMGAVGLVAVLGVLFVWKSRRDAKRIQHLMDVNTIAETSAVAIAEMRLEEMEYLRTIENPNRIQLAFLQIMDALKEYRAYLPQSIVDGQDECSDVPPPTGDVTVVFTDIQSSTALWEQAGDAMEEALNYHNKVLRKNIRKNGGYEVKTIGDAFMVAFPEVEGAMRFCLESQMDLLNAPRPFGFDDLPLTCQVKDEKGNLTWSGLRVRMGVNCGKTSHEVNPVTGRTDYRGPVVNKAARFESNGVGGTVSVSKEVHEEAQKRLQELDALAKSVGTKEMKGIADPQEMFLYVPSKLAARHEKVGMSAQKRRRSTEDTKTLPEKESKATSKEGTIVCRGGLLNTSLQVAEISHIAVELRAFHDPSDRNAAQSSLLKFNALISACVELLRRTCGALQQVHGGGVHCTWNATAACADHLLQSLRFSQLLAERTPVIEQRTPMVLGLAAGKALVGNVGSMSRKNSVVTGQIAALSVSLCPHAWALGAQLLAVVTTADGPSAQISPALRLVDLWGVSDKVLSVYEVQMGSLEQLGLNDDFWASEKTSDGSPSSLKHNVLIRKAIAGDTEALADLRTATPPEDSVMDSVIHLLRAHVQNPVSLTYRMVAPGAHDLPGQSQQCRAEAVADADM